MSSDVTNTPATPAGPNTRATELIAELQSKLATTRSTLNDNLKKARVQNDDLKAKLVETRETLNGKIGGLRAENRELREGLTSKLENPRAEARELREGFNSKLEAMRAENRQLREGFNSKLEAMRAENRQLREGFNSKLETLREENRELRRKVASYERRHLMKNVDSLSHNREGAMDDFFAEVEDETPYRRFGSALRTQLGAMGFSFDGRTVADTGVGPGLALHELLEGSSPKAVVGYDFSSKALEVAQRAIPHGRFEHRGIYDPPSEQFDVVICTEVLEHLERPADALHLLAGMLNPGGSLVLTVPDGRIDFSAKHTNFWSPESWGLFLRQSLADCEVETGVFAPYPETGHQTNIGVVHTA